VTSEYQRVRQLEVKERFPPGSARHAGEPTRAAARSLWLAASNHQGVVRREADPDRLADGMSRVRGPANIRYRCRRPEPVNLRCFGRNPTVIAPGAPSNGSATDPVHTTASFASLLIMLIGGGLMKPAMNRLCGLSSAATARPTGFAAPAGSGKPRRSDCKKMAVDYGRTGGEADDPRRIPRLG
jgi:hypothetical protein